VLPTFPLNPGESMEFSMTTLALSLMLLVAVILALITLTALYLTYQLQIRLMRISSERLGIPAINMEDRQPTTPKPPEKPRMKISVPIPGMQMFKPKTDKPQ
jgi:hypothetical protein